MTVLPYDAESQPRAGAVEAAGETLAFAEWHRERRGEGPTLLFVHATGFHGRIWDQVVRRLPARHTICIDLHGHGRSTGLPVRHWQVFCAELAAFVDALDLTNVVAIGHSLGGHAAIGAASAVQHRFRQLILIDPVVMRPQLYEEAAKAPPGDTLHPASRRRRDFDSVEAMVDRFRDRLPYNLFTPDVLLDYCRHGLVAKPEGGLTLACSPEMEASVYTYNRSNIAIIESIRAVQVPVLVLRARESDDPVDVSNPSSPTWPGLADSFARGREIYRPDLTHFMPMQCPEEIAAIIDREIAGISV